jgi:glycosyltransferase involved in cell wall biosynthesis
MNAAALLPHTRLYGGVKRFFELGAALARLGHRMTVFTPDGAAPGWGDFGIEVRPFAALADAEFDVVFFTERQFFEQALQARAKHRVFYHVRPTDRIRRLARHPRIQIFACSTNVYRHDRFWYRVRPFLAAGGVDTTRYPPRPPRTRQSGEPFVVMAYGRLAERRKGTQLVVAACERLYRRYPNLRLLLFDTPVSPGMRRAIDEFRTPVPHDFVLDHPVERNAELFHRADVFVAAEKKTGWANTVAEAMASGVPVIATRSGTRDMLVDGETGLLVRRTVRSIASAIERMLTAPDEFRARLALDGRRHIEQLDWQRLAERIVGWYEARERRADTGPAGPRPG